jgi:hypothetical protein
MFSVLVRNVMTPNVRVVVFKCVFQTVVPLEVSQQPNVRSVGVWQAGLWSRGWLLWADHMEGS